MSASKAFRSWAGGEGPSRGVGVVRVHPTQQILDPVVVGVRVAFDVEEQVGLRRRRQRPQAEAGSDAFEQLVQRTTGLVAFDLDARLFPDPLQGRVAHALQRRLHGKGQPAERRPRRDLALFQPVTLLSRDPCHQRQVVVGSPLFLAPGSPPTQAAVVARLGIGVGEVVTDHRGPEASLHRPVVGGEVGHAKRLGPSPRPTEGEVHRLRYHTLHSGEQLRVEADLEDGARLRLPGELGVHDLVRPTTEVARTLDAPEEVGAPLPAPVVEDTLVDDVGPTPHQVQRVCRGGFEARVHIRPVVLRGRRRLGRLLDGQTLGAVGVEDLLLVRLPALAQHVGARIRVGGRAVEGSLQSPLLEGRQVMAREERADVGGGVDRAVAGSLHGGRGLGGGGDAQDSRGV
ncbi:MAG: hypothetical protein RJQ04_03330 [Longimicrobiales bacterium]